VEESSATIDPRCTRWLEPGRRLLASARSADAFEHRPARGERDQHAEHDEHEHEQAVIG